MTRPRQPGDGPELRKVLLHFFRLQVFRVLGFPRDVDDVAVIRARSRGIREQLLLLPLDVGEALLHFELLLPLDFPFDLLLALPLLGRGLDDGGVLLLVDLDPCPVVQLLVGGVEGGGGSVRAGKRDRAEGDWAFLVVVSPFEVNDFAVEHEELPEVAVVDVGVQTPVPLHVDLVLEGRFVIESHDWFNSFRNGLVEMS